MSTTHLARDSVHSIVIQTLHNTERTVRTGEESGRSVTGAYTVRGYVGHAVLPIVASMLSTAPDMIRLCKSTVFTVWYCRWQPLDHAHYSIDDSSTSAQMNRTQSVHRSSGSAWTPGRITAGQGVESPRQSNIATPCRARLPASPGSTGHAGNQSSPARAQKLAAPVPHKRSSGDASKCADASWRCRARGRRVE